MTKKLELTARSLKVKAVLPAAELASLTVPNGQPLYDCLVDWAA